MVLFLAFILLIVFYLAGRKWARLLHLEFSRPAEAFLICTSLGHVFVSLSTMGLAFAGWFYPAVAWSLLAAIFALTCREGIAFLKSIPTWRFPSPSRRLEWPERLAIASIGILFLLALILALAPPIATDSLVYHLAIPKAFLENHGLVHLPNNFYSLYPQQMEMLFLFALALGGDGLAQLSGLLVACLTGLALWVYFQDRFGPRYAVLAPAVFFLSPTFFSVASNAYVDVQTGGFIFLAYFSWERWRTREHSGWFYLLLIFTGCAVATKLTAVIILPVVFLGILMEVNKRGGVGLVKYLSLFALVVAFFILPWWGRNYFFTGNPFAPYFMQVFGGDHAINWDLSRGEIYHQYLKIFGMGHGLIDFLLLPVNLTFFSTPNNLRFDGQIGMLYLFLMPGLLGLKRNFLPLAIVFMILMVFWFTQTQQIRLLTPAFLFLSIILTAGLRELTGGDAPPNTLPNKQWRRHVVTLVFALGLAFNMHLIIDDWRRIGPLQFLSGSENRHTYLTRHIRSYPLFKAMNESLPDDAKVLFVYMRNFGYLAERDFVSDTFLEAHTLKNLLKKDATKEGLAHNMKVQGITHLMFNDAYIFGKDAALTTEEQNALLHFLETRGKILQAKNGYSLYELVLD
jgi:4-amino-4-deoxy-L-arabinose transferase-like glycosyltransferase